MIIPRVESVDAKTIRISNIDPVLAHCLYEIPDILAKRSAPGAHERLFQDLIADDAAANADWHNYTTPELHHLFASAGDTITRDLTGLADKQVIFPAVHLDAWLSALNQTRLILAALHNLTETDMEIRQLDLTDPRHHALLRVHLLGDLLYLLIAHSQGGQPT